MRARGYITADARNQTEYGTVRSYIAVGSRGRLQHRRYRSTARSRPARTASAPTARSSSSLGSRSVSRSRSSTSTPARRRRSSAANINPSEDTGDGGKAVTAYTAQFGNGFSASISAEGQRNAGVFNGGNTCRVGRPTHPSLRFDRGPAFGRLAQWPDVVGNLRVDQAWGSAQIMGAIHDVSGQYYTMALRQQRASPSATNAGWAGRSAAASSC